MAKRARQKAASNSAEAPKSVGKHGKTPDPPATAAQQGASNVGRPSKFTQEVRERIIGAVRSGAYNETACAFAGIGESTFYRWLEQARQDEQADLEVSEYREFWEAIQKAQSEAEIEKLLIISNAAKGKPTSDGVPGTAGQWQAAAWFLERKHPERYGRRIVTIPDPDPEDPRKKGKPAAKKQYFRFGGQVLEI